jgi:hypothetical protein
MILNRALATREAWPFSWDSEIMENGNHWRQRAAEMRKQAAQGKEPFIVDGFLALAAEYERMAEEGARWTRAQMPTPDRTSAHHPSSHPPADSAYGSSRSINARN